MVPHRCLISASSCLLQAAWLPAGAPRSCGCVCRKAGIMLLSSHCFACCRLLVCVYTKNEGVSKNGDESRLPLFGTPSFVGGNSSGDSFSLYNSHLFLLRCLTACEALSLLVNQSVSVGVQQFLQVGDLCFQF